MSDEKRPEDRVFTCPIPSRRPTAREVLPPRRSVGQRNDDRTVAPPNKSSPEPIARLGAQARVNLDAALAFGDEHAREKALDAALALKLDHPAVHDERSRRTCKRRGKFKAAMEAARIFLNCARALNDEVYVREVVEKMRGQLSIACQNDPDGRAKADLLTKLGTSEDELDLLPLLMLTAVPDQQGTTGVFERRHARPCRTRRDVVSSVPEPIRRIAPSERIEPEPPGKIAHNSDGSYELTLPNGAMYRMERDEEFGWVYSKDGIGYRRVFEQTSEGHRPIGFTDEPPLVSQIVPERHVQPLLAFVHEFDGQHFCYLAVQEDDGRVIVYEAPWSDTLLEGDLVEIVRWFTPAPAPNDTAEASAS